ncbi:HD domain-containing protein [Conexibacter sp. DBS9H8]|uniref:HD domain-containing protein n=1 Tax=Conexibacter sp. DBS9H8 TaxID=2937801 RepID=UPI00200D5DC2|nr:HD domain-containing protein [Conexibacter sp. DBS9H8]
MSGPARTASELESDLRALIASVTNPHLRRLIGCLIGPEGQCWPAFAEAPAAKHYHHAYRHGLLEHSLVVAEAVSAIAAIFGGVDRDLAVCGSLLHDIGKLEAYTVGEDGIEMSHHGRLQGEIALGYFRIRSAIDGLGGFPDDLAEALLHIILSHHGSLEHGSPVVPATREATLVHMADNLGSKFGSFDRVQAELAEGARWSGYDRGIGAAPYFGPAGADEAPARRRPVAVAA